MLNCFEVGHDVAFLKNVKTGDAAQFAKASTDQLSYVTKNVLSMYRVTKLYRSFSKSEASPKVPLVCAKLSTVEAIYGQINKYFLGMVTKRVETFSESNELCHSCEHIVCNRPFCKNSAHTTT